MTTLNDLILAGSLPDAPELYKAIAAAWWAGQSHGQEIAESEIRGRLRSLPPTRYTGVQAETIRHLLGGNPCAIKAPVCPSYPEILAWEIKL